MKKEFHKEYSNRPIKDIDTQFNARSHSAVANPPKPKNNKPPDLRDVDDFESLLCEPVESQEKKQTTEHSSASDRFVSSGSNHAESTAFSYQQSHDDQNRKSAGLDFLPEKTSSDEIHTPKITRVNGTEGSGSTIDEVNTTAWETFDIELPSLGHVRLSVRNGSDGLCFRLSTENESIKKLLMEKTQKIESQLADALKKRVRFMGSER